MPAGYAWWQAALSRSFIANRANAPVVLFVDDDDAIEIGLEARRVGAGDLASAVRELVDVSRGVAAFRRILESTSRWSASTRAEPPPSLPLLAITVLAASRMRPGPNVRATNYFLRLAEVLHPEGPTQRQVDIRDTLRGAAFNDVARMWRQLDDWVTAGHGERGISTIRTDNRLSRIGYPLSQALVNRSDRATLTRFFAAARIHPGEPVGGVDAVRWIAPWPGREAFSSSFRSALGSDELRPLLESMVAKIAESWDGEVVTADGSSRIDIRLAVDAHRWQATWAFPVTRNVDHAVLVGQVAGKDATVTLTRDPSSSVYEVEGPPPVDAHAVSQGFHLTGDGCTAYFSPLPIRPLIEDPDVGGWLSVPAFRPYKEHLVLAAPSHHDALEGLLNAAAEPGWRKVKRSLTGSIGFDRVVFRSPAKLAAAAAQLPQDVKTVGQPETAPRPRLINGLRLETALARNVYLAGGEPDLQLPASAEPRHVATALDGTPQDHPFQSNPSGFPIEIRRIGPLETGRHEIEVDGRVLEFHVYERTPEGGRPETAPPLGWSPAGKLVTEGIAVRGGWAPGSHEDEPLFARRGKDGTWIVMTDGSFVLQEEPSAPAWIASRIPGVVPYHFAVWSPEGSAWLVQRSGQRWTVRPIEPSRPQDMTGLTESCLEMWKSVERVRVDHPLWNWYVRAARAARGA